MEKTPIKWRVLEKGENGQALLLADQILDGGFYADTTEKCTWESSDAHTWCQETFWNQAFTEEEQAAIALTEVETKVPDGSLKTKDVTTKEYVYLPSVADLCSSAHGFEIDDCTNDENRAATNTAYCGQKEGRYAEGTADTYWCRDSLLYEDNSAGYSGYAYQVFAGDNAGSIGSFAAPDDVAGGYRPMLVLDLSKTDVWSTAGTATPGTAVTTASPSMDSSTSSSTKKSKSKLSTSTTTSASWSTGSYRSSGSSSYSAVKKPKKVTLKKAKATGQQKVNVMWKWFANQSGFQMQYAENKKFTKGRKTQRYNAYRSSATVKKLKKGKTYYFRVRACKKSGGKTVYGKWSSVKKAKIK